jgi:hypothetical protein
VTAKAKPCRICAHPDRGVIDRALNGGQSPRSVRRRYSDATRRALTHHRDECLENLETTGGKA